MNVFGRLLYFLCLYGSVASAQLYNLGSFWQSNFPYKLIFSSGVQTINTWACTAVTIQRLDRVNRPSNWSQATVVNLSGSNATFYSDNTCDTVITTATITSGTNSVTVYFNFSTSGSLSVSAASGTLITGNQTETVSLDPYTWIGGGGNSNSANGANWFGGASPGAANRAIFDSNCTSCNVTVSANLSIAAIYYEPGYTGTISQGAFTITTSGTGFPHGIYIAAGTFSGGTVNVTDKGDFDLVGGTFNSTSASLIVAKNFYVGGTGTFNAGTGTVAFGTGVFAQDSGSQTITPGAGNYNNINFNRATNTNQTISGTLNVLGAINITNNTVTNINTGTINAYGNVTATTNSGGSATINFVNASGGQTISGVAGGWLPNVGINAPGGVTLANGANIGCKGNWTWTSGVVTTTGSTVTLQAPGSAVTFTDSSNSYDGITVGSGGYNFAFVGPVVVNSLLTINQSGSGTLSGAMTVLGNIAINTGGGGGGVITLAGASPQTITGTAGGYLPSVVVNSSGGVTLSGSVGVDRDWTWTSGTVTTTGSTFIYGGGTNGAGAFNDSNTQFNNVIFERPTTYASTITGTMNILGDLTLNGGTSSKINSGNIGLSGNLNAQSGGGGTTLIGLLGASAHTITGVAAGVLPSIGINTAGGVTLVNTGTIVVENNWIWTTGAVTTTGSTIQFGYSSGSSTINDSNTQFNNVTFGKVTSGDITITGTLTALGNVNIANGTGGLKTGTINVGGNLTQTSGAAQTASINFNGSGAQSYNYAGGTLPSGAITINKTGGSTLTLATAMSANSAGQNFTITSGNMNMAGFAFTVNNVLTIGSGTTLTKSGGTLTYGSLVNNGTLNP